MTDATPAARARRPELRWLATFAVTLVGVLPFSACKSETPRTEIIVGVATDLAGPAPLHEVQVTAYGPDGSKVLADQPLPISGNINSDYELPGTYAVYSDQGRADRVRLVLVAKDPNGQVIVQRTAVLNLVPGKTLFVRLGVVSACMGKLDCPTGDTCIEGRCAPEDIDSSRLPDYLPGMEKQVSCASAVNFVDTSTKVPLAMTAAVCPDKGVCQEGVCLGAVPGSFAGTKGAPTLARSAGYQIGSSLVTLADGSVLLAGGIGANATPVLAAAETYDPATERFTAAGSMATARVYFGEARLANGRVLIAGGINEGQMALATAELYDPTTRTFTPTHVPMTTARVFPGLVTLTDGRVLVVGGMNDIQSYAAGSVMYFGGLTSAEIYDPATDTFTATGALTDGRAFPHVTAQAGGGALVLCGYVQGTAVPSLERFDPASGAFGPATPRSVPAGDTGCSSDVAELRDGRLLLTMAPANDVWLLDPTAGQFTQMANPPTTPPGTLVAVLGDGRVLYAGAGTDSDQGYLFDPGTGAFAFVRGQMTAQRPGLMGAALANGDALIVGAGMPSAEIFHAPGP